MNRSWPLHVHASMTEQAVLGFHNSVSFARRSRHILGFEPLEGRALLSTITGSTSSTAAEVSAECCSSKSQGGTWTVMVYITGDNLNPQLAQNILQMENLAASLPSSVKIVVYWSQPTLQKNLTVFRTGDDTQVWSNGITSGMGVIKGAVHDLNAPGNVLPSIATTFQLGTSNSGDADTLENFMEYSKKVAPAQHYALIFSDHGGGVDGFNYDSNFPSPGQRTTELNVPKIAPVLSTLASQGMKLSDIAFDECVMASTEVEYGLRSFAPYIVASEENVAGSGYDFEDALDELTTNPGRVNSLQFANKLVVSFEKQYYKPEEPTNEDTLSNVSTTKLNAVIQGLKRFANDSTDLDAQEWAGIQAARSVSATYGGAPSNPFRDLGQFLAALTTDESSARLRNDAQSTLNALNQAVISKTLDARDSTGLTIVLPQSPEVIPENYDQKVPGFVAATGWNKFLEELEKNTTTPTASESSDWAEPNNKPTQATRLSLPLEEPLTLPNLTLPSGDVDWFKFSFENPVPAASFSLTGEEVAASDAQLQAYVVTQTGFQLVSSVSGSQLNISLERDKLYFLKVSHADNGAGFAYSLVFNPNSPAPSPPVDIPGTNLSQQTAYNFGTVTKSGPVSVPYGSGDSEVMSLSNADQDAWYQFNTPSSIDPVQGSFVVTGQPNLAITLYSQNGTIIGTYKSGDTIPYSTDGGAEPFSFSVGGAVGTYQIFFNDVNSSSTA